MRTPKVLLVGALMLVLALSLVAGGLAQDIGTQQPLFNPAEPETQLQNAPLNPEFLAYFENPPAHSYGYVPPTMDLRRLQNIPLQSAASLTALPSRFDWRDTGKVTPVKNQNPCGTCWAFATLGAIESRVLISEATPYDFSEQNLACCIDPSYITYHSNRCDAGLNAITATDLLTKKGTRLEPCDPYDPGDINTEPCNDACSTIKRITGFRLVADSATQTSAVKNAIYTWGPVSAAMLYYDEEYHMYPGNIWYWPAFSPYDTNHAIALVGWDDSIAWPEGGGSGVWIVRNSWGPSWGNSGYFYLCYGSGNLRLVASYRYGDYNPNQKVYYWDEAGLIGAAGYGSDSSAWMASVFTAQEAGSITHVDFWTTNNNAQYQILIFAGRFGATLASQSGTCGELGYYSVPLSTPVSRSSGQEFTVAVKMTTPGAAYPLPVEFEVTYPVVIEPPIQTNVCFVRHYDSDQWEDVAQYGDNVCLRAKMTTACGNMDVSPITWSPTVNCGQQASQVVTVSATGGPVYGVKGNVTSGPSWLTVDPPNLGNISSGSSKQFTMTASPPLGTCGDFFCTVTVSNSCQPPSPVDIPVTIRVNCAPPTVAGVTPSSGSQGATLNGVVVTGTNLTGATAVSFGEGIAVNSFVVNSPTQITGNISISHTAVCGANGTRVVSVTTPCGTGNCTGCFFVQCCDVSMGIDPSPKETPSDSDFTVDIKVWLAGQAVDFAEAHIDFDKAKLEVKGITPGPVLTNVLESKYGNGTIDFGAGAPLGSPAPTSTFVLATVQFHAKSEVDPCTPLTFVFQPPLRGTDAFHSGESVLEQRCVYDGCVRIISVSTLYGAVHLQGRPDPPNPAWVTPLTVALFQPGTSSVVGSPQDVSSNSTGGFVIAGLPSGTYDIGVKCCRTLSRLARGIVLSGPSVAVDFGTLREGDANNDDFVGGGDYSLLYVNYGKTTPEALAKCDFNRDGFVGGADYSLLYINFGKAGEMPKWPVP